MLLRRGVAGYILGSFISILEQLAYLMAPFVFFNTYNNKELFEKIIWSSVGKLSLVEVNIFYRDIYVNNNISWHR